MYQINVNLTDKDYWAFNRYYRYRHPAGRIFRGIGIVDTYLMLIASAYYAELLFFWGTPIIVPFSITVLLSTVLMFLIIPLGDLLLKWNLKRYGSLPYDKETILEFHEDYLTDKAHDIETVVNYFNIDRIGVGKTAIYIYIGLSEAIIIPFRVFETDIQKTKFLKFIHQKIEATGNST